MPLAIASFFAVLGSLSVSEYVGATVVGHSLNDTFFPVRSEITVSQKSFQFLSGMNLNLAKSLSFEVLIQIFSFGLKTSGLLGVSSRPNTAVSNPATLAITIKGSAASVI